MVINIESISKPFVGIIFAYIQFMKSFRCRAGFTVIGIIVKISIFNTKLEISRPFSAQFVISIPIYCISGKSGGQINCTRIT